MSSKSLEEIQRPGRFKDDIVAEEHHHGYVEELLGDTSYSPPFSDVEDAEAWLDEQLHIPHKSYGAVGTVYHK